MAAVVVAVCEKILVSDPYHIAVGYAAAYVLFLSVSGQCACACMSVLPILH